MTNPVRFIKIEALQNDFLVVREARSWTARQVAAICDRRRGVGADGVILLGPSSRGVVGFDLRNADGSRAEWSGNGLRCAATSLVSRYPLKREFSFRTRAGVIEVAVRPLRDGVVEAAFVRPRPTVAKRRVSSGKTPCGVNGPWVVDAGNPHWVFLVRDFSFAWEQYGHDCQKRAGRTRGVNVEFVRAISSRRLEMRLFERGVGPTPSSGSGALAGVAVCRNQELVTDRLTVVSPGGNQAATCDSDSGSIRLAARARIVFTGSWQWRRA